MDPKFAFFDNLYKITSEEDFSDDDLATQDKELADRLKRNRAKQQAKELKEQQLQRRREVPPAKLQHRRTAPASSTPLSFQSPPSAPKIVPPLRRANTLQEPAMPKRQREEGPAAAGDLKRKRTKAVKTAIQPIERQVFRGKVFCKPIICICCRNPHFQTNNTRKLICDLNIFLEDFIRNNDKSAERKMRMEKAKEYGAEVVLEFSQGKIPNFEIVIIKNL